MSVKGRRLDRMDVLPCKANGGYQQPSRHVWMIMKDPLKFEDGGFLPGVMFDRASFDETLRNGGFVPGTKIKNTESGIRYVVRFTKGVYIKRRII